MISERHILKKLKISSKNSVGIDLYIFLKFILGRRRRISKSEFLYSSSVNGAATNTLKAVYKDLV
jgi:hypothetical protein